MASMLVLERPWLEKTLGLCWGAVGGRGQRLCGVAAWSCRRRK
jgi:hypothetical protein